MTTRKRVTELVRERRQYMREAAKLRRIYEKTGGFTTRYPLRVMEKKVESLDIILARLGYNPDGLRFD